MTKEARLEILDKDDQVVGTEMVSEDFNPLDTSQNHHIPEGAKKLRLTLLNEDGTEAETPEIFVVGTRSDIISILEERKRDTQLEMFLKNHSNASEGTEFVAMNQGDLLSHIRKLR